MKKILSLLIATLFTITCSISIAAETKEISFPMNVATGIIKLEGGTEINTNLAPDVTKTDSIVIKTTDVIPDITSVKLVVEGERNNRGYLTTAEYQFTNYEDINCKIPATKVGEGDYWKLSVNAEISPKSEFLPEIYTYIYSMSILVNGSFTTDSEKVYNDWGNTILNTDKVASFEIVKDFNYDTKLTNLISDLIPTITSFKYVSKEVKYDYPFLVNTDYNKDGIITRLEVENLSYSEYGLGHGVKGFEGLASQISDFFNKKNNGKITFKITTAPASYSAVWDNGGVPSTQVGILQNKEIANNIIGLFFNYEYTGSLVAVSTVDASGYVTFDITDVLDDINGNTIGTIKSIYYGLVGGIGYSEYNIKGIKIEQVILSTDDEQEKIIDTIAVDDTDSIEENEGLELEDDDTEAEIVEDDEDEAVDDEDTATVVEDIEEENTEDTSDAEEDANPNTGVALAIVPMAITGLITFFSRKRK